MLLNYNIISKDCTLFNKVKQIYEASFPIDERRNELNFEHIASHEAKFNILGIDRGNDLIGFINYWKFDTFVYIDHFAIDANKRGDGVGSESLRYFLDKMDCPVIIEVEPPVSSLTKRRVAFYERMGFKMWNSINYMQPPYDNTRNSIELKLMTLHFNSQQDVLQAAQAIGHDVYTKHYNSSMKENQNPT